MWRRMGETVVLVTAVQARRPATQDFMPLTVDYVEKHHAAGVLPENYGRRDQESVRKNQLRVAKVV